MAHKKMESALRMCRAGKDEASRRKLITVMLPYDGRSLRARGSSCSRASPITSSPVPLQSVLLTCTSGVIAWQDPVVLLQLLLCLISTSYTGL